MICKVCNRFFMPKAKDRYQVVKGPTLSEALIGESNKIFECFDCPKCGCQNIVNIREGVDVKSISASERSS